MRVAVLGAGGTIAPAIVRDLAGSDEVTALRLLDLDLRRAEEVAIEHGGPKAQARAVDANRDLAADLDGIEVLVNSAAYRVNLAAMEACLEAGCHYMDLGGLYHVTARQLELGPRFEQRGLLALLGIGSAPGKTNLLAARARREIPGPVDSIMVAAAGRDLDPPDGMCFPYALRTLLDEITLAPMALIDGRPIELEPLQAGPTVDFGDPIGEASTIYTLHSEVLTFGDGFDAANVTFALSLSPAVLDSIRELAGADEERIAAAAAAAQPPSPRTVSVHVVELAAGGTVVRGRSFTPPHERWGLGGGIVSTASPAAAAVRLLAAGRIGATGAHPPEACIDPDEMFGELEARGVRFEFEQVARDSARSVRGIPERSSLQRAAPGSEAEEAAF
ncbi:MAG: saccharopine dehydrogenase family protein [Solirubrobacterales bacterium]